MGGLLGCEALKGGKGLVVCWRVIDSVPLSSFKGGLAAGGLKGWMRASSSPSSSACSESPCLCRCYLDNAAGLVLDPLAEGTV